MPAKIIDGKAVARRIMAEAARRRAALGFTPGLAAVLVGEDPASHLYVSLKERACRRAGIHFEKFLLAADVEEKKVLRLVDELNRRDDIHAVLVQLPLPPHLDEDGIIAALDPAKDVDGFHQENRSAFLDRRERIVPGLVGGIMKLIDSTGVDLAGKTATVVSNSRIFYEPLEEIMTRNGIGACQWVESSSPALKDRCRAADILIVAVGRPRCISGDMVKPGAVVIDVGTNRVRGGIVGDADIASVKAVAGHVTPVPGGVGPVTVAMLIANTVALAEAAGK